MLGKLSWAKKEYIFFLKAVVFGQIWPVGLPMHYPTFTLRLFLSLNNLQYYCTCGVGGSRDVFKQPENFFILVTFSLVAGAHVSTEQIKQMFLMKPEIKKKSLGEFLSPRKETKKTNSVFSLPLLETEDTREE